MNKTAAAAAAFFCVALVCISTAAATPYGGAGGEFEVSKERYIPYYIKEYCEARYDYIVESCTEDINNLLKSGEAFSNHECCPVILEFSDSGCDYWSNTPPLLYYNPKIFQYCGGGVDPHTFMVAPSLPPTPHDADSPSDDHHPQVSVAPTASSMYLSSSLVFVSFLLRQIFVILFLLV